MRKLWRRAAVLALGLLLTAAILAAAFWPAQATVAVEAPQEVRAGQTFEVAVVVRNASAARPFPLAGIALSDGFGMGAKSLSVLSSDPPWENADYESDSTLFKYSDIRIDPRGERRFVFLLRAERAGVYRGNISVLKRSKLVNCPVAHTTAHTTAR